MKRVSKRVMVGTVAAVAVVAAGGGVALAGASDAEVPITGADLERASAAALDHTGGGRVTDTEVGDEESYYEVEVTRDDGSQVDVQLDRDFAVVTEIADVEDEPTES